MVAALTLLAASRLIAAVVAVVVRFCINYGLLLFFDWGVVTAPMARFLINYGLLLSFAWGVVAALRYLLLHA